MRLNDEGDPVACAKGKLGWGSVDWEELDRTNATVVDVVLRANGAVARQTPDLFEIWDGEVVVKGVLVEAAAERN
jgi:hypothetical protein